MIHFTCVADSGPRDEMFKEMALVCMKTAIDAGLKSYLLYDGSDTKFTRRVLALGGHYVARALSFKAKIKSFYKDSDELPFALGTYLRVDVPKTAKTLGLKGKILYTDADAMFLKPVPELERLQVKSFAVCHQRNEATRVEDINNGIILFEDGFVDTDVHKKWRKFMSTSFGHVACDQGATIEFIKQNNLPFTWLNEAYNFKAWKRVESTTKILHFHGFKPHEVGCAKAHPTYKHLHNNHFVSNAKLWDRKAQEVKECL